MAVNPPPIQEKTSDDRGFFPQVWARWFNDLWVKYNNRILWFDDNDLTTQAVPISHSGGATDTYLTNDSSGAYTNQYNPGGYPRIWDSSNNQFDFSHLKIGDVITFRVDLSLTTSANNQEFDIVMDLAIGGAAPYTLHFYTGEYKNLGTYGATFYNEIYIGNTDTLNYPAKFRFESVDNASIKVNGWFTKVITV